MHVSRNKCELIAEYLLEGVNLHKGTVKNIQLNQCSVYIFKYFKTAYLSSLSITPKDELYWIWFDSLSELFYMYENNLLEPVIGSKNVMKYFFKAVVEKANENIEKRKKMEEIDYV